jgi:uncharacterized protein
MRAPLLALLLLAAIRAVPAGYPEARDPFLNDLAGLVSTSDAATLRGELGDLRRQTGVEAVVVTVPRLDGLPGGSIEDFATGLFNHWGVGDANRNDGLMLLVARDDRKIRIEVGEGYGDRLDAPMKQVIDGVITPRFRSGRFSEGLLEGARAMVRAARPAPAAAQASNEAATSEAPAPTRQEREPSVEPEEMAAPATIAPPPRPAMEPLVGLPSPPGIGVSPLGFFGVLAAGVAGLVALIGGAIQFSVRKCPRCNIKLEPLDEAADDAFLNAGQKAEESLGSVDHDVLRCPSCQYQQMVAIHRWFSGYHACPLCTCKTLKIESDVLESATTHSTGLRRITRTCLHCSFNDQRNEIIPRRPEPSRNSGFSRSSGFSGSSRSFGGGRSRGGGASGGW